MRLMILGAGGYGRIIADVAAQVGLFSEIRFLDDASTAPDVLGPCERFSEFQDGDTLFYPAFGKNELRMDWIRRLRRENCRLATIIHPSAYVSPKASVMPGTAILPKAVVNTGCLINTGCIVNCGAIVDRGCILEEGVHVSLGAIVKGDNRIPAYKKIEAGDIVGSRTYPV